jgi:hypothetical protein
MKMTLKISESLMGCLNLSSSHAVLGKRVALEGVRFLKLYTPLKRPLSILMDTRRVWNADLKDVVGTAVAVIALVSTIFQHPAGTLVTTIKNIYTDIGRLGQGEDCEEVLKNLFKISNNIVSLALMAFGGLELAVITVLMQPVMSLIESRDAFKQDLWIEGVSNFMMSGVRLRQSSMQYQLLTKK